MAANRLTVEVARRERELEELRADWGRLLERSARPTLFAGWEWTTAWCAASADRGEPLILALRDGTRLVGLAPLRLRRRRIAGALPYRVVELAAAGVSEYLDLLAEAGREGEVVESVVDFLAGPARGAWDALRLDELPSDSPALALLGGALDRRGLRHRTRAGSVCPFLSLEGGWDGYLAGRSKHFRKKVAYLARRARRDFDVTFEEVAEREALHAAFDRMLELHDRQWGDASPLVRDPRVPEFHHRFLDLAADKGWPRIFELRFDGRLVASQYWLRHGDAMGHYQGGRDPDFDRFSVGIIVLYEIVSAAAEAGVREVDLLRGDEGYKSHWATGQRQNVDLEAWPRSVRGSLGRLHHDLVHRAPRSPGERAQ